MTSVSRSTRRSSRLDDEDSKYEEFGGRGQKDDYKSQSAQLRGMKQPILREQVDDTRSGSGRVKEQVRKIEQRRTRMGDDFDDQDEEDEVDEEEEDEDKAGSWQSKLTSTGKDLLHKTEDLSKRLFRSLKDGEQSLESDLKKGIKSIRDDIVQLSSQRVKSARAENLQEEEEEEEDEDEEEDDSISRRTRSADKRDDLNEDEFDLAAEKSDEDRMDWEGGSIHHLRERGAKAIRGFKANIEKAEGFVKQQKNKILKELPTSLRGKQVEEEEEEEEEEEFDVDEDVSEDVEEDLDVDDMSTFRSKVSRRFDGGESFLTPQRLIGALAAMWLLFFLLHVFTEPIEQTRPAAFFDKTNLKGRGAEFAHDIKERAQERMEKIKADTIEFIRRIELGGIQQPASPPSFLERSGNWLRSTFWPTRITVPQRESSAFQRFKDGLRDGMHRLEREWQSGDSHGFVPHEADNNMYESPSSFGIDSFSRQRVNRADDAKPVLESMGKEGLVKEYLPEDLHQHWADGHPQDGTSGPSFWNRLSSWFGGGSDSSSTTQQKSRGGMWNRFQNNLRQREGIRTGERGHSIHHQDLKHQALKYGDKQSEAIFSEPRHVEMRVGPDLSQTHIINPRQQTIHSGDQEPHSLQDDIRAKLQSGQPINGGRSQASEGDSSNPSIIDRAEQVLREGVESVRSHLPHMPDMSDVTSRPIIPGLHRAGEMLRDANGLNSPTANMHVRETLHNGGQRLREGADHLKAGFKDGLGDAKQGLHNIESKFQDRWESVKDGASDVKHRVERGLNDAKEYVEDATHNLRRDGEYLGRRGMHNLEKGGHRIEEGFNEAKHRTQEFVEQGKHRVEEKFDDLKDRVNYHMP